jgi:hypothetical protein
MTCEIRYTAYTATSMKTREEVPWYRTGIRPGGAIPRLAASARERAVVFSLRIATALFIEWDIERALMTVHRWSPRGYSHTTCGYP